MDSKRDYEDLEEDLDDDTEEAMHHQCKQDLDERDKAVQRPHRCWRPTDVEHRDLLLRKSVAKELGVPLDEVRLKGWTLCENGSVVYSDY